MMSSSYRNSLDEWLKQLNVKANRVMDIGGSQLPIKGRTMYWHVKEYKIADLPDPHVNSPKPDIAFDLNEEIFDIHEFKPYDLIFCLEVFDYIWNPAKAMKNIADLLIEGGTAWVSFPSFYPLHQPVEDDALRYMPAGIVKLAEFAELSVEQMIKRRPETDMLMQTWRVERMRAAKHEDHEFTGFICEFKK